MTWFWLSLIPPFLWAVSNHMDKYLVERFYRDIRPGTYTILAAMMSSLIPVGILLIHPAAFSIGLPHALTLMAAGLVYFSAVFPYMLALMRDEASRVIPLFQLTTVFSFIMGWLFLHEQLTATQMLAGLIVMLGALAINVDIDNGFKLKKSVFFLMVLSALLFTVGSLLFKVASLQVGLVSGVSYQYLGAALGGVILAAVSKGYRHNVRLLLKTSRRYILTFGLMDQAVTISARIAFSAASLLAPLALVSLVTDFQPFFVIVIGILLTTFAPHLGSEALGRRHLAQKIIATGVMFAGTWLLLMG